MCFDYNTEYFLVLLLSASGSQSEMILALEDTWKYLEKYLIVISGEVQLKQSVLRQGILFNKTKMHSTSPNTRNYLSQHQ